MKHNTFFLSAFFLILAMPLPAQDAKVAPATSSIKQPHEYLEMINRLTRLEQKLLDTEGTRILDPELTRECQQLCRDLGIEDEGLLNWDSLQDTVVGTRAVCTGCNLSQTLVNLQTQVNTINSLLDDIEAQLASVACSSGTCTFISTREFPKIVDTAGSYCLRNSTAASGFNSASPAITITADDVTINLNCHSIFLAGSGAGIKVESNRATIENGRIIRNSGAHGHGIHIQSTGASTILYDQSIMDVILTGNGSSGSGCGLYLEDVSRVIIDEVTADKNSLHGIQLEGTSTTDSGAGVVIQNSRARSNIGSGFHLTLNSSSFTDGVVVQNCIAMSNGTTATSGNDGFYLSYHASTTTYDDVLFKSNIALANASYGYNMLPDGTPPGTPRDTVQLVNNFARGNSGTADQSTATESFSDPNYNNIANGTGTSATSYVPTSTLSGAAYWRNITL